MPEVIAPATAADCRQWSIGSGQTAAQRAAFEAQLQACAVQLERGGGPFLHGASVSLDDLLLYPFMRRFDGGLRQFASYSLRERAAPAVGTWLDAMAAREACLVAAPDECMWAEALRQHRSLDFFDYSCYDVFALHPHNAGYLAS